MDLELAREVVVVGVLDEEDAAGAVEGGDGEADGSKAKRAAKNGRMAVGGRVGVG